MGLATLACVAPALGDDVKWRPPKIRTAATLPSPDRDAATSSQPAKAPNPSENVLRTSHQDGSDGPRLAPIDDARKEPRKLKSVLERRSSAVRPILEAQTISPNEASAVRQDANVVRAGRDGEGDGSEPLDKDPFETGIRPQPGHAQGEHRQPQPLRLAQGEKGGRPVRSVLQLDPFDDRAAAPQRDRVPGDGRFVSQPFGADPSPPAQKPLADDQDAGFQPGDAFARDTSIDAERERAADVCARALETIQTKRIDTLDLGIHVAGAKGVDLPFECSLETEDYQDRDWQDLTFMWKASALCHKPLYFEDIHLERYGHSWGWQLQPLVSAAHFFTTIPILPYKMGLETPNECVYALGYYRPGNCAPYLIEPLGTSPRAVVWQAGAVVGFSAIVP